MAVSRQEGERGPRNRKTEGRTDESERTRSGRRITGTADEDGREERARAWTVEGNRQKRGTGKRTRRAGCQTVEELPCCWSLGGDVVSIASPRIGRGGRPSLSLSADTSGRSGERLAMVWTVKTSDGAEERRGTGEDGGGILRPGSLSSFSVCSFALPFLTT